MTTVTVTRRNLLVFFRDKSGVFFSLLSALILIALYALFLGNLQVTALEAKFPGAPNHDIQAFVDSWVFAGITSITTLTTALAALSVFVDDRATGRFSDFLVAPIRRWQLTVGYLLSSFLVSIMMTTAIVIIGQVYLGLHGSGMLSPLGTVELAWRVVVSSATFAALGTFAVTFLKSTGAFAAVSTVVGTLAGFLAGAYIPAGTLPQGVVNVMNALPFAQSAMLIRQPYTATTVDALAGTGDEFDAFREFYGITTSIGDLSVTNELALLCLLLVVLIFTGLGSWRLSRRIA